MKRKIKYAVGVDLGGTNIKIGIVTQDGRIIKKTSVKTEAEEGPRKVIENIKYGIHKILDNPKLKVDGIGIGCPGAVSSSKGTVEHPPNIPGWKKVNLGKIISMEFEKDVFIDNDANAAAIGEMIFGNGKNYKSFIMITLGTGVGGGVVIDKKIYHGEHGAAGEIGHISINHKGPKCNCGSYGCIEAYAGNQYLNRRVRQELKKHPSSKLWKLINNDLSQISPHKIQLAAEMGDKYAMSVIENLGIYLGAAFASLSNVLDIGVYIIGGGVAGFGKPLLSSIQKSIRERVMTPIRPGIKVLSAKLKNDAGIKGASALVFHHT